VEHDTKGVHPLNDNASDVPEKASVRPNTLLSAIEVVREPQDFESGDALYRADLLEFAAKARRLADLAEGTQMWVAEAFRLAQIAGWSAFGTHIDQPTIELEFSGQDEDGQPLWERPKGQGSSGTRPARTSGR
jgi:hypothetical protein